MTVQDFVYLMNFNELVKSHLIKFTVLLDIAILTGFREAEDLVYQYMVDNKVEPDDDERLSLFRKQLFQVLRDSGKNELKKVNHNYDVLKTTNIWDSVLILERENLLDTPAQIDKFAHLLGKSTAQRLHDAESADRVMKLSPIDKAIKTFLKEQQQQSYQDMNLMGTAVFNEEHKVNIADVFTDLKLLQSTKQKQVDQATRRQDAKPTNLVHVLKMIKYRSSCKVLITGKGGMGKTTLLRYITYNWANNNDDTFSDKVLFLVNIRDIEPGKTVIDTIVDDIDLEKIPKTVKEKFKKDPTECIKTFMTENENEIVILLDGLDELKQGAKKPVKLLKFKSDHKNTTIITSRPENITTFVENCNVHVEVNGFSEESMKLYIHNYFTENPKLGKTLIRKLKLISCNNSDSENSNSKDSDPEISDLDDSSTDNKYTDSFRNIDIIELCSSPLILLLICSIWEESEKLSNDLSDLFKELICCTLNQYLSKINSQETISAIVHFDQIQDDYKTAILALGQCIYERLKSNELIIEKSQFQNMIKNKSVAVLALKIGFVYKKPAHKKRDKKEIYAPPHKLVSEALAGFYLADKCKSGDLKEEECEMIGLNKYLHMTIIFTIGFLGDDAGRLMKHLLKVKASNLYSLAKYFRYVKEEHKPFVIEELEAKISSDEVLEETCLEMSKSFRYALDYINPLGEQIATTEMQLVQLMSRCYGFSNKQWNSVIMKKRSTKPTTEFCTMVVHFLIFMYAPISDDEKLFKLESFVKDNEIDNIETIMNKFQFQYGFKNISFDKSQSPNFLIHCLKYSPNLKNIYFKPDSLTIITLNQIFENVLPLDLKLHIEKNDLSNIDAVLLSKLVSLVEKFTFSDCNLSVYHLNALINFSDEHGRILTWENLNLSGINLSSIRGSQLACLLKFSSKLKKLNMSNCHLSGSIINDLLDECDKINVVLKPGMFYLKGNNLSDIDGASLYRLVNLNYLQVSVDYGDYILLYNCTYINFPDYSLSVDNLRGLADACYKHGRLLTLAKLNLSGINLASIEGSKIACLLKFSPQLERLDMSNCHLSGSVIKDLLNECDKINVVLKPGMFDLRGNNLSDIDGVSLFTLVDLNCMNYFASDSWCYYHLSVDNLKHVVETWDKHGRILICEEMSLSSLNLSSIEGSKLACLLKFCPELQHLDMSNCHLSGSIIKDLLKECDKNNVVLKPGMLDLKENNLSDIDGVSLSRLVDLMCIVYTFKLRDYSLSVYNLKGLIDACYEHGRILTWEKLSLSGLNLASIEGSQLACLLKFSPKLKALNMINCNLFGSIINDLLKECDKYNVVLKPDMLDLNGNNCLSIDVSTLFRLMDLGIFNYSTFKWNDYISLSIENLRCLIDAFYERGYIFAWEKLSLRGINLASIEGSKLACLLKLSPQLQCLDLSNCHLSGSVIKKLLNECDKNNVLLKPGMLDLKGNNLSDIDGVTLFRLMHLIFNSNIDQYGYCSISYFAWNDYNLSVDNLRGFLDILDKHGQILDLYILSLSGLDISLIEQSKLSCLLKFSPQLQHLDMSNCHLSGSIVKIFFNECDKNNVVLKPGMLGLRGNNLSDINGSTLFRLVNLIYKNCYYFYIFNWNDYILSVDNLTSLVDACYEHDMKLTWERLNLSGINLASIKGSHLASLLKFSPDLKHLGLRYCHLSGSIINDLWNECGKNYVVLKPGMFDLRGNNLSEIDGVTLFGLVNLIYNNYTFEWWYYILSVDNLKSLVDECDEDGRTLTWKKLNLSLINLSSIKGSQLAILLKCSPELKHLDMSNCHLSGSIIKDVLNECNKKYVVLKPGLLDLKGNNLSDIDGVTLFRLVDLNCMNCFTFKWNYYSLSVDNLKGLIDTCYEHGGMLKWERLDLSGLNLSSIEGSKLACLLKFSPELKHLDMSNCHLSGSIIKDLLNECDKYNVVLKPGMLDLMENNLSDIDGVTLLRLVNLIDMEDGTFEWYDYYSMSVDNLEGFIDACYEDGRILNLTRLSLNGINLGSIEGSTLAFLLKFSPNLECFNIRHCNLSGSVIKDLLTECDQNKVVLKPGMLDLHGNNLSDIDGVTLFRLVICMNYDTFRWHDYILSVDNVQELVDICKVNDSKLTWSDVDLSGLNLVGSTLAGLIQFSPFLEHLSLENCNLSGGMIMSVLNECERNRVVLKKEMLNLMGNDLSDITDETSVAKLQWISSNRLPNLNSDLDNFGNENLDFDNLGNENSDLDNLENENSNLDSLKNKNSDFGNLGNAKSDPENTDICDDQDNSDLGIVNKSKVALIMYFFNYFLLFILLMYIFNLLFGLQFF